jgi:hypothetical protein
MRVSNLLKELSEKLTDPDNEILVEAEKRGSDVLLKTADALTSCAWILKMASEECSEETVTEEEIDEMAALATSFDESGDEFLVKQAAVIDEILLTIGSKKNPTAGIKKVLAAEEDKLREKYRAQALEDDYTKVSKQHKEEIGAEEAKKAIDAKIKKFRPMEASLSTRYSPDMPGTMMMRIGDGVFQCPITKKIYNFNSGFTTAKGNKVPGGSVENQTQFFGFNAPEHANFSTREEALNGRS